MKKLKKINRKSVITKKKKVLYYNLNIMKIVYTKSTKNYYFFKKTKSFLSKSFDIRLARVIKKVST